ncbi:MAG: hypothetical protein C0412_21900 [Flavobacterium sp.]|nr:hypothetical protein [Flavobacterium sp.]
MGLLEELKNNHPEFNIEQLKSYSDIAKKENIKSCEGRSDEKDCVIAVTFLREDYGSCGHFDDEKAKIDCSNPILSKVVIKEVDKCHSLNNDDLALLCLQRIFSSYSQPKDCLGLKTEIAQRMCEAVLYYQTAVLQTNKELCNNIKDEFLKIYCFKHAVKYP